MLTDVNFQTTPSFINEIRKAIGGTDLLPSRIELGLYQSTDWSFDYLTVEKCESFFELVPFEEATTGKEWYSNYGVCDSPEQFKEHSIFKKIVKDKENYYVVCLVKLEKKECSPTGGWRWHKWGPYIGKQKPTCEYLYDEPVIETVYTYHIYRVSGKNTN